MLDIRGVKGEHRKNQIGKTFTIENAEKEQSREYVSGTSLVGHVFRRKQEQSRTLEDPLRPTITQNPLYTQWSEILKLKSPQIEASLKLDLAEAQKRIHDLESAVAQEEFHRNTTVHRFRKLEDFLPVLH